MYAVFEDGSRQYRVSEGEQVTVDLRDVASGSQVIFDHVLLIQTNDGTQLGRPYLDGARVVAEVLGHPSTKYYSQKYRRRKNYRRYTGHRQFHTQVKISHILKPGQEVPAPAPQNEAAGAASGN
jgi:large subunit ribosomal protein L21